MEIELQCYKNEIIQGELLDVLVKIKNNTNDTIITGAPKHFLHAIDRDTSIVIEPSNAYIEIPPYGIYSYFIDPLEYIGYNEESNPCYPWYYWFESKYEYSIAHFVGDEKFISNKIQIKVNPVPDSLQSSFNELKDDIQNPAVINFATYKSEKLESLFENFKDSYYGKEFYYKLLKGYNYYEAIGNKGEGAKYLRERAINLYKNFILNYPNSDASYTFLKWIYFNYSDNMFLLDEIISFLKKTDPNCWLLEALNNQPDYMFKEIKHLLK